MTCPRLVATDLDGTALRTDGSLSPRTAAAFARVEEAGSTLVFVTGRPPRWMHPVAGVLRHRGLAICANGALVYDLHTEEIVESRLITCDILEECIARLRRHVPELTFSVEYEEGFAYEPSYPLGHWDARWVTFGREVAISALTSRPGAKLLAQHPSMDPDELYRAVLEMVGDIVTPTHSSGRALIEISAQGVTKATALGALAEERGIKPAEAIAFGDMPNDLPMLTWAGTSYAVANAHPDVLAAVDHVTAANNDDGVAVVLEDLF
ncbi:hydrolase [Microbispora rosea subsp. aerata]|nr:HAD family hydrolase [Microbispora rosea]GGO13108.1 hydrolase [Microbispora rosea subsp. aerata]GIH58449.1 hydrolase [Microbispora rosea subsp. aerata]GLJ85177.1 hydrolase [Microbispora rosea subsp. aerata]